MSAMIESYDAQMLDYNPDIDIHMHPSASDPWLHEVQMEDDQPGLKNLGQREDDITIEIDMDEHSTEYDMVDDEQIHNAPSPIVDVEVYDVSLAQSPAMVAVDSPLPTETFLGPSAHHAESSLSQVFTGERLQTSPVLPVVEEKPSSLDPVQVMPALDPESHQEQPGEAQPSSEPHIQNSVSLELLPSSSSFGHNPEDNNFSTLQPSSSTLVGAEQPLYLDETAQEQPTHNLSQPDTEVTLAENGAETPQIPSADSAENVEETKVRGETASSGDPHEISEGVYIDPPPPVLLSTALEDLQFQHSFFNAPGEWHSSTDEISHHVLLHHLPTLYYEPLSALFDALRQEEFIQSLFQSTDAELILEALDLTLTLSEDNIYAREVSLHDLNMLHDASGISGPLRLRLYVSTPRFIVRYQQLQEHVSRLQIDPAYRESSTSGQVEPKGQSSTLPIAEHTEHPNHQNVSTEPHIHNEDHDATTDNVSDNIEPPVDDLPLEDPPEEAEDTEHLAPQEHEETTETERVAAEEPLDATDSTDTPAEPDHDGQDNELHCEEEDSTTTAESYSEHHDGDQEDDHFDHEADVVRLEQAEAELSEEQGVVQDETAEYAAHEAEEDGQIYEQQGDDIDAGVGQEGVHTEEQVQPTVDQDPISDEHGEEKAEDVGDGYYVEADNYEQVYDQNANQDTTLPPSTSLPLLPLPEDIDQDAEGDPDTNDFFEGDEENYGILQPTVEEATEEEAIPELPTEPISFDDDQTWDGEYDSAAGAGTTWNEEDDADNDNTLSTSNQSSVTLSSRASKRTFDEYESGGEGFEDVSIQQLERVESPDPKRSRVV